MKAWRFHEFGMENLVLEEVESPPVGAGEVRIRMRAASLNYRDLLMVKGRYNPRMRRPLIPCSDGVGEVVEVGAGVQRVQVGDRVAGCFAPEWQAGDPESATIRQTLGGPRDGTLCEEMVLPAYGVVTVPAHLTDEEAATLPCAALTAWSAMFTMGNLRAGDTVLVQGSGGVSVFALAFARMAGARVVATTSSADKEARLRELGADHVINYREVEAWGRAAKEWTGGRGVDQVIEVGGAGTLEQSLVAVRTGGHVSLIGILAGVAEPLKLTSILMRNVRVQGILVGHREGFEAMNRAIDAHGYRPEVDRVFAFAEADAAFAHLASGRHVGKVCVRIGDG
ncbi:MAG: NAD(P)-dependent alcohol dehydrogenase [Deltaproteobacteria bacterium]|nr:MAG: NAD(P)-dependent alcohol dehydrogenase [Deltaproteobacteria bacterium]